MSAGTQPIDYSDLYTELLNRTRSVTGVTAVTNQAKRYINMALQDMVMGFEYKMPWLERTAILRTHNDYSTGTVSISRGSTTLTGDSTAWTTANSYGENNARTTGKLILAGGVDIYTISAVGGATTITLNDRYVADSDLAAGSTYIYFEDEYALASDFLKPIDFRIFSQASNIELISRNDFRRRYPRPNVGGTPTLATLLDIGFGTTTTPVIRVQLYPYPTTELLIPYSYITANLAVSAAGVAAVSLSSDTDEPNMPLRYRPGIVLKALAAWYRDKKDDAREQSAMQEYVSFTTRVVEDQNMGAPTRAQLQVDMRSAHSFRKRPYKGSGRGYSTNNSFDDFRT